MSPGAARSILVIEDNSGDARLLSMMLGEEGTRRNTMTHVESLKEAERYLSAHQVDVMLLDPGLPDSQGLATIRRARAIAPHVPLVVMTGLDDELLAVQALQEGAQDYLVKGQVEPRGLARALQYAVERKNMEEALFLEKERAQVTLNSIGDAVASTDTHGKITFLNVVAEQLTGWSCSEAIGRPMADVIRILDASTRLIRSRAGLEASPPDRLHASNWMLVRRDGREVPVEESAALMHGRGGQVIGSVIVVRDVSTARAMAQQMAHSAYHDYLTGLPNRMLLNDRLGQAIATAGRRNNIVAVLFLDLDGFKHINDSLGHPIGDRLLQSVAARLVTCARRADTVSRQGGDEFVVLLSGLERAEEAAISAKRLLQAVAAVHTIDDRDLHVTMSIGVSLYPDDGLDADTLIKNADTAMYQAKENGRHTCQFFKPAMNVKAVERQFIEEGLRSALERGELALHYQPMVNLRAGTITGVEALIRWTHPERGPISPAEFIPVAEDSGLIVPIGHWVLREACRQAQIWRDLGLPPVVMAVNISPTEFRQDNFLDGLFAIVEDTQMRPSALELEFTESVLIKHSESAALNFKALKDAGVRLAIDDFGTGYSSLSYLSAFPIDSIKIDQSFVRQITTGADQPIVAAVISMGRSLKLRVIAEGVETREELAFLERHHCEEGQGYYFSPPLAADDFAQLLQTGVAHLLELS